MSANDRPGLRAVTIGVGVATMIVGILFVTVPAIVKFGNEWIIGLLLLGGAVMSGGFAFTTLRADVRGYTLLLAALSLAAGVIILVHPLDRAVTLTTLLGVYFMVESGLFTGLGLTVRPKWSVSTIVLIVAAISFVMSLLIWIRLAGAPKEVIVSLLGISFIARGLAFSIISLMMKGQAPLPPRASDAHPGTPEPAKP